jgi:hypothetical protein
MKPSVAEALDVRKLDKSNIFSTDLSDINAEVAVQTRFPVDLSDLGSRLGYTDTSPLHGKLASDSLDRRTVDILVES